MEAEIKKFVFDFLLDSNHAPQDVSFFLLPGDGSKRIFWRVKTSRKEHCFIAMANLPKDDMVRRENLAYYLIGTHLYKKGIPVPRIYRHDFKRGLFIMEDMGRTSLQELVSSYENPLPIYEKVLEHLFRLQIEGAKDFNPKWCCQTKMYDRTVMRRYEANYFRDVFLCDYLGLKKEWSELEGPFNHLAETASMAHSIFFLHRDFQSRNIMVLDGNIGIIDWQGGRIGPLEYDLASLLIDPYTGLSHQQKNEVYHMYLLLIKGCNARWTSSFERHFPYLAIQRNLQILGAFSFLAKTMKKRYFEAYIPNALITLCDLLKQVKDPELSPLRDLVADISGKKPSSKTN